MGRYTNAEKERIQEIHEMKLKNENPFRRRVYTMHGSYTFTKEDIRRYCIEMKKTYDMVLR